MSDPYAELRANMPLETIIVDVSEMGRSSWLTGHRLLWKLGVGPTTAVFSRANIRDARARVERYLDDAGYGYVRPKPLHVYYRFDFDS